MTDVVIIGAGPAGLAAAISAAQLGLRSIIIEGSTFPRHRPGETFHPGAEAVFRELGVTEEVSKNSSYRHRGQFVSWSEPAVFQEFGRDENGPWKGYQISRGLFDSILLVRARALGVKVMHGANAGKPVFDDRAICGVETSSGLVHGRIVIDASGRRRWSLQSVRRELIRISSPLRAKYGYRRVGLASPFEVPVLRAEEDGWTWIARLSSAVVQWTRLVYPEGSYRSLNVPDELSAFPEEDAERGADVTWSIVWPPAENGCFAVGDAAIILDPLSSHGNLNAMMTGIIAARIASSVLRRNCEISEASAVYTNWILERFQNDCHKLAGLYGKLAQPPSWLGTVKEGLEYLSAVARNHRFADNPGI